MKKNNNTNNYNYNWDRVKENNKVVEHYVKAYSVLTVIGTVIDEEDLRQAGMMGLAQAAYKYNPEMGVEFNTYADKWVKGAVLEEIRKNGYILRISKRQMEKIPDGIKYYASLDDSEINEYDMCRLEGRFGDIQEELEREDLRIRLEEVLDSLPARAAGIVKMRIGWEDDTPRTFKEIGEVYGITAERAGQIFKKTLRELENDKRCRDLIDYLEGYLAESTLEWQVSSDAENVA